MNLMKEWFKMSQEDILDFLKENPKEWYSSKDIETYLGCKNSRISKSLKQLRKFNLIEFEKESSLSNSKWLYSYKEEKNVKKKERKQRTRA